jgi:hypothetical protein
VAALVAERLNASPALDHGVFHVDQLFDPPEVFAALKGHGISVDMGHVS